MTDLQAQTWQTISASPEQTLAIGRAVGSLCHAGDLVALVGELGAGKTQFVRGLVAGMGLNPAEVASPTFVMVHEYLAEEGRPNLVHIDAYRLKSVEDLESIGWDISGDSELRSGAVVVIEWADRLEGALGDDVLEIDLVHAGETQRQVTIRSRGNWIGKMATLRRSLHNIP